jgi:hypothetical protein
VEEAMHRLGMTKQSDKVFDLEITLLPHQILGLDFMLEKEKDAKFRGGILADAPVSPMVVRADI